MKEITKPPVSAQRADDAELQRMILEARRSPLFQAILDWMDGAVVILNEQRQIVMASPNLAKILGVDNAEQILGCRLGEAFGCVHSKEKEGGCGASGACARCGALNAILNSRRLREPIESECRISLSDETGPGEGHTIKLKVKASQAFQDKWEFTVIVLQPSGPAGRSFDKAQTVFSHEAGWPGETVPFVRIRKLGEGGMGNVFLVRGADGREYALKTIREEVMAYKMTVERFLRESELAVAFDHPNIVKTYKAGKTATGLPYMVSQYCERGSAGAWLQNNGPAPAELALYWIVGVARALKYLWSEHRLVHRDIKPDNLLLDSEHRVKVTDFGIAMRPESQALGAASFGEIVGSVLYLAPEQIAGENELDVRADLYALGTTFFELVTGTPPFGGATPSAVLSAKLTMRPPPVNDMRNGLPRGLDKCIDWLLEKNMEDRPLNPEQLLDRLSEIAERERIDLDEAPAGHH